MCAMMQAPKGREKVYLTRAGSQHYHRFFLTIFSHNHVDWDFFIHETSLLHHMHGRIADPMASAERDVLSLEEAQAINGAFKALPPRQGWRPLVC